MHRKLVVVLLLLSVVAFSAGKAQAAEPLPEEAAVVVVAAPEIPSAVEEAVPSSGGESKVSSPPWWLEVAEGALLSLFALIASAVFGYVGLKVRDNVVSQEALRALEAGVNKVWLDTVRELKHGAQDGKLTAREKQSARDVAIATAKNEASAPARKLLEGLGKAALESIVSKIIRKRKSGG